MTTYTDNKLFPIQPIGSNVGKWGRVINDQLIQVLDKNLGGIFEPDVTGSLDYTVSEAHSQYFRHNLTGTITADIDYVLPARGSFYTITNSTIGAYSITVTMAGGAGFVIPSGSDPSFIYANPETLTIELISAGSASVVPFTALGLHGDGRVENMATFNAAILKSYDRGGRVFDGGGKTYIFEGAISMFTFGTLSAGARIPGSVFQNFKFTALNMDTSSTLIGGLGTLGTPISLTSSATYGTYDLAINTTGTIAADDWLKAISTDLWATNGSFQKGETIQVQSVTSGTNYVLADIWRNNYTAATTTVAKLGNQFGDITLQNFEIVGGGGMIPTAVCLSQSRGSAGALTLNGTLVSGGIATFNVARPVVLAFASDESLRTFTVFGTSSTGSSISQSVAGDIAGSIGTTTLNFKTVTSVTVDMATAGNITVGANGMKQIGIDIRYSANVRIFNAKASYFDNRLIQFFGCPRFTVDKPYLSHATQTGSAYGIGLFQGCRAGIISNFNALEMRHPVSLGGTLGVNLDILINGGQARNCDDAVDSHASSDGLVVIGVKLIGDLGRAISTLSGTGDGFISQGWNTTWLGCSAIDVKRYGFFGQNFVSGAAKPGSYMMVDCICENVGGSQYYVKNGRTVLGVPEVVGDIDSIVIANCISRNSGSQNDDDSERGGVVRLYATSGSINNAVVRGIAANDVECYGIRLDAPNGASGYTLVARAEDRPAMTRTAASVTARRNLLYVPGSSAGYVTIISNSLGDQTLLAVDTTLAEEQMYQAIRVDATAGNRIITMPQDVGPNAWVTIRKYDTSANTVTLKSFAGVTLAILYSQYDSAKYAFWDSGWVPVEWDIKPFTEVWTVSGTHTKPPLAAWYEVLAIGAGGAGGSGRQGAAGSDRFGGGGGAAGAITRMTLNASDVGSTVTVTVPVSAAGGAAVAIADTDGNAGTPPATSTTFGTLVKGTSGGSGSGGTATAGAAGTQRQTSATLGTIPAAGASTTGAGSGSSAGSGVTGSGGAGGGISTGDTHRAGGDGGNGSQPSNTATTGGTGGAAGGTAGTAGASISSTVTQFGGSGAGGGGGNTGGAGGAGAAGGNPGGGGGGGGASANGSNSGAGGAGGRGELRVTVHFK